MFQQDRWNPDARCKRQSDFHPHAPELISDRVLRVLSRKQPDPDLI